MDIRKELYPDEVEKGVGHGHGDGGHCDAQAQPPLRVLPDAKQMHLHPRDQMEGIASTQAQGKHPVQNKDRPTVCLYEEDSGGDQVEQEVPDVKDTLPYTQALGHGPLPHGRTRMAHLSPSGPVDRVASLAQDNPSQYEQGSY